MQAKRGNLENKVNDWKTTLAGKATIDVEKISKYR
jgi:hypothetical protein